MEAVTGNSGRSRNSAGGGSSRAPGPASEAPTLRRGTLPPRLNSFIGREADLAELTEALRTHRLLSLTGAGGVGKTRLATEAAARLAEDMADGACLVDLSELEKGDVVPSAVAAALGIGVDVGAPVPVLATLTAALREASLVLVLDSCERVVPAVSALVSELLGSCAGLRVVATSREPLRVPGQVVWSLAPLEVPSPDQELEPSELGSVPAVQLFVDRARAVRRGFDLDAANAGAVATICRSVEGLPLGIELAATWLRALSPIEIAEGIGPDLGLLRGSGPGEDQSLRAAFDRSHALLDPDERAVFDRLGPFSGFTSEAVEAVCATPGLDSGRVAHLLARLVDKSLVVASEHAGRARYRRLATVRAFAAERFAGLPDAQVVRARHARWYLGLAEQRQRPASGAPDFLEIEYENLIGALAWAVESEPELALRLFVALRTFWESGSRLSEGFRWGEALLAAALPAAPGAVPPALLAEAAEIAGAVAIALGRSEAARTWLEGSLEAYRGQGDGAGAGRALVGLGTVARHRGELGRSEELLRAAGSLLESSRDRGGRASALIELGRVVALRGREVEADQLLREALGLGPDLGEAAAASALNQLGMLAALRRAFDLARSYHEQALGILRRSERTLGVARTLGYLGELAWRQLDFDGARSLLGEALSIQRRLGDLRGTATSLTNLAHIEYQKGRHAESSELYREVLGLRRQLGDRRGEATALAGAATALWLDEPTPAQLDEARSLADQAVAASREVGDRRGLAWALSCQAEIARDQGDTARAEAAASESIEIYRTTGEPELATLALYTLATVAIGKHELDHARSLAAQAAGLALAMGSPMQQLRCVELAARLACAEGHLSLAARLYGAAEAGRTALDQGRPRPFQRAVAAADRARLRERLSTSALEAAWDEGRRMTIDRACASVVGVPGGEGDAAPVSSERPAGGPRWQVQLLGDMVVSLDRRVVEPRGRAVGRVVKLVALRQPVAVDEVVDVLWPEAPPGVGRQRLNNLLSRLRRVCGDLVIRQGETLRLSPGVEVDVAAFGERAAAALAAARSGHPEAGVMCRDAVVLYRGDLLPADRYEDWTASRRVHLSRLYLELLDALAEEADASGRYGEAVEWLGRAIDAEPLDESRYQRAAAIMVRQGWRHRAQALAVRARRITDQLGVALPADLAELLPGN